ncbi:MAG: hypothetical protein ACSHXL_05220 [Bacteroidota bacterium]
MNNEKSCCSKSEKKDDKKHCDGNCQGKSCKCVTHVLSAFILKENINIPEILTYTLSKKYFSSNEYSISLDYSMIWSPPKIA